MTSKPMIIARFHPQAWVNDYAIEVDGAFAVDVTDKVLAMGRYKALKLRDDQYETDNLIMHSHNGPFWVEVQEAIWEYYNEVEA